MAQNADPTRMRVKCDDCGTVAHITAPEENGDGWAYAVEPHTVTTKVKSPDGITHEVDVEVPTAVSRSLVWKCPNTGDPNATPPVAACGALHTITEELAR